MTKENIEEMNMFIQEAVNCLVSSEDIAKFEAKCERSEKKLESVNSYSNQNHLNLRKKERGICNCRGKIGRCSKKK